MKNSEVVFVERLPTTEEFLELRRLVKWSELEPETVERGLKASLYSVCLEVDGRIVGCGRIVGDGSMYFYVQDVILREDYRGRGLGRAVMDRLMGYVAERAARNSIIGLFAAKGASGFYEKLGFSRRPEDAPGMFRYWGRN